MSNIMNRWVSIGGFKGEKGTATALATHLVDQMHRFGETRQWPENFLIFGENVYNRFGGDIVIKRKLAEQVFVASSLERLAKRMRHLEMELKGCQIFREVVK